MKGKIKVLPIIITLIVVTVVGVGIFLGINLTKENSYLKRYKEYSDYIVENKLNKYYKTSDANTYDYVTYAEAAGLCVYANTKTYRIEDLGYSEKINVLNAASIDYLNEKNIKTNVELTEENANKFIPRIEVINLLGQMKEKILEKPLDTEGVILTITKAHKLDEKRIEYLKDAVKTGVLENKGSVDEKEYIRRGELNRIIATYLKVVNPVGSEFGTVVTDKEKLPSNSDIYPFILEGVEKEIYEIPLKETELEEIYTPANLYDISKDELDLTSKKVEKYLELLLNVDYRTIDADNLLLEYSKLMQYNIMEKEVREYVEYVKAHKLVIKGTGKTILPSLYHDGLNYRIRAKINFEILEGDTKVNVLLGDATTSGDKTYEAVNNFIIDQPLQRGIFSVEYFTILFNLQSSIVKKL